MLSKPVSFFFKKDIFVTDFLLLHPAIAFRGKVLSVGLNQDPENKGTVFFIISKTMFSF